MTLYQILSVAEVLGKYVHELHILDQLKKQTLKRCLNLALNFLFVMELLVLLLHNEQGTYAWVEDAATCAVDAHLILLKFNFSSQNNLYMYRLSCI